jgi:dTDP-glucose 4,6-dehydratase
MKVFVTGGAGFIGSSFVRYVLNTVKEVEVINFDLLTYAGNLRNLESVASNPRYTFIRGDIAEPSAVMTAFEEHRPDVVVNFAAETHVDRSIEDASPFLKTNVLGTRCLLESTRHFRVEKFVQISTDEVYGSLGPAGAFSEETPLDPSSPYSASKAGADLLALSYFRTYGIPVVITRCCNNYGPYQFPEKLLPVLITNAMENRSLPIYGDGMNVREWIHADEHSRAVWMAVQKGKPGNVYNVGSGDEKTNLEIVRMVLEVLGKPESLITFVKDRPGHDRRYAIDHSKIRREWGWKNEVPFEAGLQRTVEWYLGAADWMREIKDDSYLSYYERMYTQRDETLSRLDSRVAQAQSSSRAE